MKEEKEGFEEEKEVINEEQQKEIENNEITEVVKDE